MKLMSDWLARMVWFWMQQSYLTLCIYECLFLLWNLKPHSRVQKSSQHTSLLKNGHLIPVAHSLQSLFHHIKQLIRYSGCDPSAFAAGIQQTGLGFWFGPQVTVDIHSCQPYTFRDAQKIFKHPHNFTMKTETDLKKNGSTSSLPHPTPWLVFIFSSHPCYPHKVARKLVPSTLLHYYR
jgi:hypothetical protein